MTRYCAKPGLRIPMPGSPGQFVPEAGDGIGIDLTSSFYARLIADRDLIPVADATPPKPEGKK